jgi:hypothetical protein
MADSSNIDFEKLVIAWEEEDKTSARALVFTRCDIQSEHL